MNLWILLCALILLHLSIGYDDKYHECKHCFNLEAFYEGVGCRTNCRRNNCITGYNCRIPLSRIGKECFYKNHTYFLGDTLVIQASPFWKVTYTCMSKPLCEKCFVLTGYYKNMGVHHPVDMLILSMYDYAHIKHSLFEEYPVILIDVYKAKHIDEVFLPPSTCGNITVHCCFVGNKKYRWNTDIDIHTISGIYRCICRCSPFLECELH